LTQVLYHSKSQNADRLVMLAIANFENTEGCWASQATIERVTGGLNRRTIQRSIDKMVKAGELTERLRKGATSVYYVAITCPDDCDNTSKHNIGTSGLDTATQEVSLESVEIIPESVEIIPEQRSGHRRGGGLHTAQTKDNLTNERERKKTTTIPADFIPKSFGDDVAANKTTDLHKALHEFIEYWTDAGTKRANWEATWRNNLQRVVEMGKYKKQAASIWDTIEETR